MSTEVAVTLVYLLALSMFGIAGIAMLVVSLGEVIKEFINWTVKKIKKCSKSLRKSGR